MSILLNSGQGQRQALDAFWEFVKENPQDFNGWVYLIQACEAVDILDETRTVYNAFLPLFPYCYAYWKRYSDIEIKNENWSRALAILNRGLKAIPLSVDLWVTYLELYFKMYSTNEDFPHLYRFVISNYKGWSWSILLFELYVGFFHLKLNLGIT